MSRGRAQCVSRIKAQCVSVIKAQSRADGWHEPSWPQELSAVLSHPQAILQPRLWSEVSVLVLLRVSG